MQDVLAAAAFSALAMLSIPLFAQPTEPIVVTSSTQDVREWTDAVSRELDRQLMRTERPSATRDGSGIVQVLFECDETGKPVNLAVYNRTGNPRIERQAMRAISRIDVAGPMPSAIRANQQFLANIIYANSARQSEKLTDRLATMEQARLASKGLERTFLAIK